VSTERRFFLGITGLLVLRPKRHFRCPERLRTL
jgi:hypothetical protein